MGSQAEDVAGPDLALGVSIAELGEGGLLAGHVGDAAVVLARCGDELFAGLRAVELAHGAEGSRAFARRVQKALEQLYAECVPPGADPRGVLYPIGGGDAEF